MAMNISGLGNTYNGINTNSKQYKALKEKGWLSGLNLLDRKDLGLFCEVFAAIGVESKPIKDVSTIPCFER